MRAFKIESWELWARALVTIGVLAIYHPLLTFDALHVTDDGFTSDIWNGELPARVWTGAYVREHGQLPTWNNRSCSGAPVVPGEPLSLALFTGLRPGAALDVLLIAWLLLAAHGAYSLARRLGAERPGAVLCGIAFGASGYLVTQLKHLGIVGTVVWLPLALVLLDRALAARATTRGRVRDLALFGLVLAEQALSGFPQSTYICALVYGAYAVFCVLGRSWLDATRKLALAAAAALLGAAGGAAALLPLAAIGATSDRSAKNAFAWASSVRYATADWIMFLFPYANGDTSNNTYHQPGLFWEDYGYVGLATFLLALFACLRSALSCVAPWIAPRLPNARSRHVLFFLLLAGACYVLVLGPATPVFRWAFDWLPGMRFFRFPQRFLIVVELALCLLAALGLTQLTRDLAWLLAHRTSSRVQQLAPRLLAAGLCLGTQLDLFAHQPRQNPWVDAAQWLAPPATVSMLRSEAVALGEPRVFTPFHMKFHLAANYMAHNWVRTQPYFSLGELLQPNSNLYWDIATADCYSGIAPRWYVDAWGDHNREGHLIYSTIRVSPRPQQLDTSDAFPRLLRMYGVTHVISPYTIAALEPPVPPKRGAARSVRLYRVSGASRVHIASRALVAPDDLHAMGWLVGQRFDANDVTILSDAPDTLASPASAKPLDALSWHATIEHDGGDDVLVSADAPHGGFLVLADTFFPGWTATVDGKPSPIYRADLFVRAVQLPSGKHRVRFQYHSPALAQGVLLSCVAIGVLACALAWSLAASRRPRARSDARATGSASSATN